MRRFMKSGLPACQPSLLSNLALRRCFATSAQQSPGKKLESILIANRGEIALRVARTAAQHGIGVSTLYTTPDEHSQHAFASHNAFNLGDDTAGYLDGKRIIEIAKREGCDAVHPGYGFLSENADFARMCTEAGLIFIGPSSKAIEEMGDKSRSKEIMNSAGVQCVPGYHGTNQDASFLASRASEIGYPILIKAVKGGGGKGMRIAFSESEFESQLISAKSEARGAFGPENDAVLIERYITQPRHVEVQVFADLHGNVVALGERDCSVQRRHQKILEESPAPNLSPELRKDLWQKARAAARAVNYCGAGTVEFILDNETGSSFLWK
ncbi:Carbamoyl-phosphate synthetase, large subunit, ATP-binding protein [Ascosphaera apis ARSEF 7405]|uniref:Carbamoyl-phosphate synthetase, large subunit, ATP-binding protein n=1 Tax=Ascosphaera apis ARSEF 7405 TaxID=392613 RepID=A0A168DV62_9EURO|nr:Carbamoyl-phosphate synthetase, large subunit, ATP-binding protein [Ascosphaera apis ARSEF 7405]